jgi:predicted RNase H-like HicB family nuclease
MKKFVYPAIFEKEEDGGFSVYFPDIDGAVTCGDNLEDAVYMAEDCLGIWIYDYKQDKKPLPKPSDIKAIKYSANQFVTLVALDYNDYVRRTETAPIRKTVYLPRALNDQADALGINFSQVLRNALEKQIAKA